MINYIKRSYIISFQFLLLLLLPEAPWAIGAPSASTSTKQIIDVNVQGAGFLGGSMTAGTRAFSTSVSTQPGFNEKNPPSPSAHFSSADIAVSSIPNPFSFVTEASTASSSSTYEPLFARSYVYGSAASTSYLLALDNNSTLNINWQFDEYRINNSSVVSFSEITDTLRISSQSVSLNPDQTFSFGDKVSTLYNFTSSIENDHLLSSFHQESNRNELNINGSLSIDMPLAYEIGQFLVIDIEHIHTEYSIEAPAVATNQVEEKIGNDGDDGTTKLSWDARESQLSFSDIPIEILSDGSDTSLQKYADDPLNGGHIEIDPLKYIESVDGVDFFEGNEIRLVDINGETLLSASLPTVVFDEALYDTDGYNLFAPILNILDINSSVESLWLQDYLNKGGVDSLLLNELFIGFDTEGVSWDTDFNAPVSAFLSYTGAETAKVPEPITPILLLIGILVFIIHLTYMKKSLRN